MCYLLDRKLVKEENISSEKIKINARWERSNIITGHFLLFLKPV